MKPEELEKIENSKIPQGKVTLVGLGRLGIRTGLNLAQIHRGGPKIITAIDSQKISEGDLVFRMLGGNIGDYKVDLLHNLRGIKEVIPIREDINSDNLDLINGDVVSIQIAGGHTIPIASTIIKKAWEVGAKTISTAGVFSKGDADIIVKDISEVDSNNPVVNELRSLGIKENHKIITTGNFITDKEPITPYVLDEIAKITTMEIIKSFQENDD